MSRSLAHPTSLASSQKFSEPRSKGEVTTKHETVERSQHELQQWSSHEDLSLKSQKIKKLEEKINRVKMAQQQLEMKFQKVVEHLSLEIQQKDTINEQLEAQIELLQNFLSQSKNDLQIIKNYLRKQESKRSCKENQRKTVNLNETIYKTNKQKARNQIFTDITIESTVTSRKSISPRMKLLKKQIKG